jgi:hypothetical protein
MDAVPLLNHAGGALPPVDHLVWGGRDLHEEIERFHAWTGVRPVPGGRHPGEGTYNALLGLGPDMYLELIAPDPGQPSPVSARWFGLDTLTDARLVAWAAKSADLDRRAAAARRAGLPLGEVRTGRRELGGGRVLSWRLTYPDVHLGSGLVPFLIDWADSPHPAQAAPGGVHLLDLRGEHPEPAAIREDVRRLGLELHVLQGSKPALMATLDTPHGRVELR